MGRIRFAVSVAAALIAWAGAAFAQPVLLISVDGLQPADVLEAEARGLALPTLKQLVRDGMTAEGVTGVLPSVTYPSHTTLVTGAAPAKHGVYSNVTFDPLQRNDGGWFWYEEQIAVDTLWDAVRAKGEDTASVSWPVTVGARSISYNVPEFWRARTADDLWLLRAVSTPGLADELERTGGVALADLSHEDGLKADAARAAIAKALLAKAPEFTTLHLIELDHQQHVHGPGSPEAHKALEAIDGMIGAVVEAGRKAQPDLVVAVVSDHGFEKVTRQINLPAAFVQAGLITLDDKGTPKDWRASVWGSGGSAQIILRDPEDSAVRAKVKALLTQLAADPDTGIERIADSATIARLGGNPQAAFWVNARPGFTMGSAFSGPLVSDTATRGMHGYFPDAPAMRATFVLQGPGVPKGRRLSVIDMRDIAPTLAKLMKVRLPTAQGRPLL